MSLLTEIKTETGLNRNTDCYIILNTFCMGSSIISIVSHGNLYFKAVVNGKYNLIFFVLGEDQGCITDRIQFYVESKMAWSQNAE